MGSFLSVGCYHCKRSVFIIREFSRLKHRGKAQQSWAASGWGGLSDSIIDLILQMAIEEKPLLKK
jgi:hypothetical protein